MESARQLVYIIVYLLYNKGEKDDEDEKFTQINSQCLKRFRVYIITFDAAKV